MKTRQHVVAKTLLTATLGFGLSVAAAAPAVANPADPDPNPFSGLRCNCHEVAPAGSPALIDEIHRGLGEGHSVLLPGLPAPKS